MHVIRSCELQLGIGLEFPTLIAAALQVLAMKPSSPDNSQQNPFVALLYSNNAIESSRQQIIKKTLLSSPVILNIYPLFKVQVKKPFQGLSPESFNDENLQNLMERDSDSQRDAFGDDIDCDLFSEESSPCARKPQMDVLPPPLLREITVFVNHTSLRINGILFPLKAAVRSSCIIRTAAILAGLGQRNVEDSLLISLKSGFLLLVRLFWVPQDFSDSDYSLQNGHVIPDDGNNIFKPFVVQWWRTGRPESASALASTGYSLHAQSLGLLIASTSQTGLIRIHNTQYTEMGMLLQKHFNVDSGGIILNSCFASPKLGRIEDHCMFLAMVSIPDNRLQLNLYSWRTGVFWGHGLDKSEFPLMLPAAHEIYAPAIFIVSLRELGGFLFVYEHKVVIVTIHQLLSADYKFRSVNSPWEKSSFPTSYYLLATTLNGDLDPACDEVHIATDTGLIYTMIISENDATVWRTFTVKDPISVFTIEKHESNVNLIYSSYGGSCRDYLIDGGIIASHEIISCRDRRAATVTKKYQNWAPVVDVAVVKPEESRASTTELWGIVGLGDSSKLCHFRSGYRATLMGHPHRGFKNSDKLLYVEFGERKLLFVSLMSSTRLLCYDTDSNLSVIEVENECFIHEERTLLISKVLNEWGEFIVQITPTHILLTNLADANLKLGMGKDRLLMADFLDGIIAIVADDTVERKIKLKLFSLDFETDDENASDSSENAESDFAVATLTHEVETMSVLSCVKLLRDTNGPLLMLGDFNGDIQLCPVSDLSFGNFGTHLLSEACRELGRQEWSHDHLVPHSACQLGEVLNVGTKDGYLFQYYISRNQAKMSLLRAIKVGNTQVTFAKIRRKQNLLIVKSNLTWLVDNFESPFPSQVCFSQPILPKSVMEFVEIPDILHDSSIIYMALIHEGNLTNFTISCFVDEAIERLPIKGLPKKMLYIDNSDAFLLLCATRSQKGKLKLVRRLLLQSIRRTEIITKDSRSSLFSDNETPVCASLWRVARSGKVSVLILLGTSLQDGDTVKGSLKVVDITINKSRQRPTQARLVELTSINSIGPISGIAQIDSDILLVINDRIYVTTYDAEEKRLIPIRCLVSLPSEISSISIDKCSRVTVLTKLDSLTVFTYSKNELQSSLDVLWSDTSLTQFIGHGKVGTYHALSHKRRMVLSMIEEGQAAADALQFRMPCLSRVYSLDFSRLWALKSEHGFPGINEDVVICIGVSGDMISFRVADKLGHEMQKLAINLDPKSNSIDQVIAQTRVQEAPFSNKASGTGLFSVDRLSFDYTENRRAALDLDLPELARVAEITVGI